MFRLRPCLNRLNFSLGRNPEVQKISDFQKFIPAPFRAVVLISADFELAWAARYDKSLAQPIVRALKLAERERRNIPFILDICERFSIPVTWATVGHLFLETCKPINGRKHAEIPPVKHYKGSFWDFNGNDWFEYDPCTNDKCDPLWYAPDLIKLILQSKAEHEIGCHTFSHIDCRDGVCPPELIRAELQLCKKLASGYGLTLASFVHPGHTIGNLDILEQEGFTNYRTDYRNVLGYPKKHGNGLWELEQTAEFVYHREWSIDYHIWRYIEIIKRAIKSNTVCVFWFHPSFDAVIINQIWPKVFDFLNQHRQLIWITTHHGYVEFLKKHAE